VAPESANPGDQGNPQAGANPGTTGDGMIPKPRFDEVNERMKAAERKLAELAAAQEARERADLEARGEFAKVRERLEQELGSYKDDAEAWRSYNTQRRETLLAGLPDEDKPLADGLPLDKLEKLVERLGKKNDPEPAPAAPPAGRPGVAPVAEKLTFEQIKEGVQKHGLAWLTQQQP